MLALGVPHVNPRKVTKHYKNRGFADFGVNLVRGKEGKSCVQKWPAWLRSIMGGLCCAT